MALSISQSYRHIAVCNRVKYKNGDVGRGAPHITVLNQPAQRHKCSDWMVNPTAAGRFSIIRVTLRRSPTVAL